MTRAAARVALLLLPRRFRQRHGRDLLRTIDDLRLEPEYRGLRGTCRLWWEIGSDLAATGRRLRQGQRAAARSARAAGNVQPFPSRWQRHGESVLQDLRLAIRGCAARPGYASSAVLTLCLGIGGATLVGGLVESVVLRPFGFPEPDRLVGVGVTFPRVGARQRFIEALSPLEAEAIGQLRSLDGVLAFDLGNRNISGGDVPERVFTALVRADPFATLKIAPAVGRGFSDDELQPGGAPAAVISYRTWMSRFGGDRSVVGRAVTVNGQPTTIVGVMPPGQLLIGTDLWLPIAGPASNWPRTARQFTVLARLSPAARIEDANAELAALAARVAVDHGAELKEYGGWQLHVRPWAEVLTDRIRPAARLLAVAAGCILLFVCANASSLQITRLSTRSRELAVRMALGASRWRVARELLTETLVLAVAGGALGLALAAAGLRASRALLPEQLVALGITPSLSLRMLLWGLGLTAASAAAVAVLPAMLIGRLDSGDSLRSDSRAMSAARRPHRLRQALVAVEVAVALVLMIGAGLLAQSIVTLHRRDPGVQTGHVLTMRLTLPPEKYQGAGIAAFFGELVAGLEATPGVVAAAAASQFPPNVFASTRIRVAGVEARAESLPSADITVVTPGAFGVLGVPLRQGRLLAESDRAGSPPVAVVNEAFARRYLRKGRALGERVAMGDGTQPVWREIVGVVGDTLGRGALTPSEPGIYLTTGQDPDGWNQLFLLIRTAGEPTAMTPSVRRVVAAMDPQQPVYAIQTLENAFAASTLQHRASMVLLSVFAGLAVVLAAIGVYAVTAQAVLARRVEIGIRMALGAGGRDVARMIAGQTFRLLLVGAALGLAGGIALGRVAAGLLVDTSPADPMVLAPVTGLLALFGLAAAWLPARRASRIDPARALRSE
jgi:putative ABC transport system permease protein